MERWMMRMIGIWSSEPRELAEVTASKNSLKKKEKLEKREFFTYLGAYSNIAVVNHVKNPSTSLILIN